MESEDEDCRGGATGLSSRGGMVVRGGLRVSWTSGRGDVGVNDPKFGEGGRRSHTISTVTGGKWERSFGQDLQDLRD